MGAEAIPNWVCIGNVIVPGPQECAVPAFPAAAVGLHHSTEWCAVLWTWFHSASRAVSCQTWEGFGAQNGGSRQKLCAWASWSPFERLTWKLVHKHENESLNTKHPTWKRKMMPYFYQSHCKKLALVDSKNMSAFFYSLADYSLPPRQPLI